MKKIAKGFIQVMKLRYDPVTKQDGFTYFQRTKAPFVLVIVDDEDDYTDQFEFFTYALIN